MQPKQGFEVITSGYVSMDRIIKLNSPAKIGFTSLVTNKTSADIRYGGCSVNISYDLHRLGIKALPIMRVGSDYEQIGFKSFLEDAGLPLDAAEVVEEERTSLCYLLQDNEGQHITLFYPGAMDAQFAHPLSDDIFLGAKLGVMTVGSLADNEIFFEACKKHNIPLVFSMKGDLNAFPRDFLNDVLHYSHIIFTNEVERDAIEQMFEMNMETLLDGKHCRLLITTLGKEGSRCYYKENNVTKEEYVPICDCSPVVDTTGSGDGFVSGFLYGYLKGKSPYECSVLGTVVSSFIIEHEGCCTGAPTEAELLERCKLFDETLKGAL